MYRCEEFLREFALEEQGVGRIDRLISYIDGRTLHAKLFMMYNRHMYRSDNQRSHISSSGGTSFHEIFWCIDEF